MATWPVHVEDWQYQCCGEAFGVGDRVAWTLALREDNERHWDWPQEMLVELRVVARRRAESKEGSEQAVVTTPEGAEVAVTSSRAFDGDVVRGTLIEEHHGGVPANLQEVGGTVRRLRLVSQRFRLAGHSLIPIPGAVRFRDVDRMPDTFAALDPHDDAPEQWREIGALAELELV